MSDLQPLTNVYVSKDFPVVDQAKGLPCEWCGKPLGESPHGRGSSCHAAQVASSAADILASELELSAKILRRETCVFGEEPLQGALDRVRLTQIQLEKLVSGRGKAK